ncbi:hypothetical protein PAMA_000731 [Pampus argenteus]
MEQCEDRGWTDTHRYVSEGPFPFPLHLPPFIPPGIAVRGMALCLGMQHAISLAHPPAVGLRDGTVPTGAPPPIIVVVHSLDAWRWGGAFPPVQWEPEVHLRWPPYVTQIHTIHPLCRDR